MNRQSGIALLLVILVISVAGFVMAYESAFLGLAELDMGYTHTRGSEAFFIADGCMEEALERLRKNSNYSGSGGNISVPGGSCIIDVIGAGTTRAVTVTGITAEFRKVLRADIVLPTQSGQFLPAVGVSSWQEIDS